MKEGLKSENGGGISVSKHFFFYSNFNILIVILVDKVTIIGLVVNWK